ncbi:hypothetical protein [Streptacidiphilus fuscans]|uniref:Uncharacterized protein n=1 Tax=Streptacidiphilus fuscans TaxID=2789292 RepID=A0A931FH63_9ACTN|nr:hypothetical protein [Streptacidiphilus fuscans]MBF9071541.1 hypothetical protein [Streptacidiphilus fuscans]
MAVEIVDDDVLRAMRRVRELKAHLAAGGVTASPLPGDRRSSPDGKGAGAIEVIGLVINGGGLAIGALQVWMARVSRQQLRFRRADGAELTAVAKELSEHPEMLERFMQSGSLSAAQPAPTAGDGPDADSA